MMFEVPIICNPNHIHFRLIPAYTEMEVGRVFLFQTTYNLTQPNPT